MKTLYKITTLVSCCSIILYTFIAAVNNPNGVGGKAGVPGEATCVQCHTNYALNSGSGSVAITSNIPTGGYVPATVYQINVTVSQAANSRWGFDFEAVKTNDNTDAGTLAVTTTDTKLINATIGNIERTNVVHVSNAVVTPAGTKTFTFNWTAPSAAVGSVTFYAAAVAANGTAGPGGDFVYSTKAVITPATSTAVDDASSSILGLSVYPIPGHETVTLSFQLANAGLLTIELQDLNGKLLQTILSENRPSGNNQHKFDVSNRTPGIYFLKVTAAGKVSAKMIVIN